MMKQKKMGSAMVTGLAAGAAMGAAGMYLAGQNRRQMKRTAKKLAKGAEQAVGTLDKVVTNLSAKM